MTRQAPSKLYSDSIVVDACGAVAPFSFVDGVDPESYLQTYADANVTFVLFTVVDDQPNSIEQTLKLLGKNRQFIQSKSEGFVLADRVEDVRKAKAAGKVAVGFAFQGSNALLGELGLVEVYRRLGVVHMLLAYNVANLAADGCHESRNAGLSQFGRSLVAEMNRVGMIVDLTHVGLRSSLEAFELTSKPPIFSHSTPRKFAAHDRNITDEQIRACASKQGVICLNGIGTFMDGERHKATVSRLVDTIEYVAQLVGARHAGIGLDYMDPALAARFLRANKATYGGGNQYPASGVVEFLQPTVLPEVTDELVRRRYSEQDVRGILGENYLRVLAANLHGH